MKLWLATALNRYLALDPESRVRLTRLQDKAVTIELIGTPFLFQLVFRDEQIQILWQDFLTPDLTIKGTPFVLWQMSFMREQRHRFFADDVVIEGNMELAQQVLAIFDELDIDWEEQLSQWIGDTSAHHLGRAAEHFKQFSQRLTTSFMRNVSEYVQEEAQLFPPREALADFYQDVDELRMNVDRLTARVERLLKEIQ